MSRLRIDFVWIDVNGDNIAQENEGFFGVFQSNDDRYVMAEKPTDSNGWAASRNCGWWTGTDFLAAFDSLYVPGGSAAAARRQLTHAGARCYLGGDAALFPSAAPVVAYNTTTKEGWLPRGGTAGTVPVLPAAWQKFAPYLFSLSHDYNPNFKGVIHVTGDVAISGTVRGRVTIATTGAILVADDFKYSIAPGVLTDCGDADMVGLFAGSDVIVADNALNTPQQLLGTASWYKLDDTNTGVFLQAVVLALDIFTVQNFDVGPTAVNNCESVTWGRGCLYLSGGVIQKTRGAVGTSNGTGFLKRYSYDVCAAKRPPPYFPTTGRFSRNAYYMLDPVGFTVSTFYGGWDAG
jgi:hypothetical protein